MEYKFNVGDKVRVSYGCSADIHYNELYFNETMEGLRGKGFIVKEAETRGGYARYKLEGSHWDWSDSMLELVEKKAEACSVKKLDIELYRFDNVVLGKILHQDDSIKRGSSRFTSSEDFHIKSIDCPQLQLDTLFVRGDDKSDDAKVIFYKFDRIEEAKKYVAKVKKAVDELNATATEEKSSLEQIM